jgi:hypothetical protein
MTRIYVQNPTRGLIAAVKQKTSSTCALIVIDEDEPHEDVIAAELAVVKACVRSLLIRPYLFYVKPYNVAKFNAKNEPVPQPTAVLATEEASGFFAAANDMNIVETKKPLISKAILEAAGPRARIFRKDRNSCFGDRAKKGNDNLATLGELQNSQLHQALSAAGVKTLIITGRYRASCVLGTSLHGATLGYTVLTASTVIYGPPSEPETWTLNPNIRFFLPN